MFNLTTVINYAKDSLKAKIRLYKNGKDAWNLGRN